MTNTSKLMNAVINMVAHGIVWVVPLVFLAYPELGKITIGAVGSIIVAYVNAHYLSQ